jgi:hypothetical protein
MSRYENIKKQIEDWKWEENFRWSVDDTQRAKEAIKKIQQLSAKLCNFPSVNTVKQSNG